MASFASQLTEIANEIAFSYQGRSAQIERELAEIETQKLKLQAESHAAHLAHERLGRFVPIIGGNLQCPRCWADDKTAILYGTAHGTGHIDTFRCRTCDSEFALSFRR